MEQKLADALLDFYQKILKPEFNAIHQKLAEHDERFSEISGHLDSIYHRLGKIEDEVLILNVRIARLEETVKSAIHNHGQLGTRVKQSVKDMKEQLAVLQSRLESVEQQLETPRD